MEEKLKNCLTKIDSDGCLFYDPGLYYFFSTKLKQKKSPSAFRMMFEPPTSSKFTT